MVHETWPAASFLSSSSPRSAAVLVPAPARAITGGRAANPNEWPWQVALLFEGRLFCGGTIVAPDVVLTAAHCTDAVPRFEVVAGSVDLGNPALGQRRGVVRVDQHEGYDPNLIRNDLSLVYLDAPLELDAGVAVAHLADASQTAALAAGGTPAVVTGFGRIGDLARSSPLLLEADVDIYADDVCVAQYAGLNPVDGLTQICAGLEIGSVDACYGDSGGPLVVPLGDDETSWLQVGVVSWGAGCGEPGHPAVYTEVAAFADWLGARGIAPAAAAAVRRCRRPHPGSGDAGEGGGVSQRHRRPRHRRRQPLLGRRAPRRSHPRAARRSRHLAAVARRERW